MPELQAAIERKAADGLPVSVDPDLAEVMGAFVENAIDTDMAIQSVIDEGSLDDE